MKRRKAPIQKASSHVNHLNSPTRFREDPLYRCSIRVTAPDLGASCKPATKADRVEQAILEQVAADLERTEFVSVLTDRARKALAGDFDRVELRNVQDELKRKELQMTRLTDLVSQTTQPAPLLRRIEALELELTSLAQQRERLEAALEVQKLACSITEADVRDLVRTIASELKHLDAEALKEFLKGMIDRIELDPATLTCRICYAMRLSGGDFVASPREDDVIPIVNSTTTRLQ